MRCSEFLTSYSDYRDGLIADRADQRRLEVHARSCERCARHDRALRTGVNLLLAQELDVSDQARVRLRVRLALAARSNRVDRGRLAAAAAVMVGVAIAWGSMGAPQTITAPAGPGALWIDAATVTARAVPEPALAVPTGYLPADSRVPPQALVYQGSYEPVEYRIAMATDP